MRSRFDGIMHDNNSESCCGEFKINQASGYDEINEVKRVDVFRFLALSALSMVEDPSV